MKKLIFGLAVLASFGANAAPFNMTYNSENPFYQPRENEFYSKTQVEMAWTSIDLRGAQAVNGTQANLERDITDNNIFVNERIGYGINRQWEIWGEFGFVKSDLEWKDLNTGYDKLSSDETKMNYITLGTSFFITRTKDFTAKVSVDYSLAPDNDVVGYGDKIHANVVLGKEWENMVLALHGGVIFNLGTTEDIDYYGFSTPLDIDSTIDYFVAGEFMYGFNEKISAQLMLKYEIFDPSSEQNINFLNNQDAVDFFGNDDSDNVFTIAGQLNYSFTKSILASLYVGMSFHSVDKYTTVDPFLVQSAVINDWSDFQTVLYNYNIDNFTTTYVGLKFNIVF